MQYVKEALAPGERLIHIGRFPWLYTARACSNILFGIMLALVVLIGCVFVEMKTGLKLGTEVPPQSSWWTYLMHLHPGLKLVALLMFIGSLMSFAHMMILRATTEIAVTSRRVIYKRGLISRYAAEISIDRIEGVNVYQGFYGRFFDYGYVIIRGMGVGEVLLPALDNPVKFRRAIEYARTIEDRKL